MPNHNWYETSEDMLMPLPLQEEEAKESVAEDMLTEERRFPTSSQPSVSGPSTSEPSQPSQPGTSEPSQSSCPTPSQPSQPSRPTPAQPSQPSRPTPSQPSQPSIICPTPSQPSQPNITVIPIIPGITMFGYIRFMNASPSGTNVDIYANGRKVAANLSYRHFTEYMKVFPGWYRIAVYAAGTVRNPLTVMTLQVQPNSITTLAVTGLAGEISTLAIDDSRRFLNRNRAYVRFVQLSPNAPTMDAYWDDALVVSEMEYEDISRYMTTRPGSHNLKMRDSLSGANLVEHPDVQVEGGKAYTIYIVGNMNDRTGLQILVPLEGATYLDFGD